MRDWLTKGKVPPVHLIVGESGIGKRTMAYFLAQWLLCERSGFRVPESSGTEDLFAPPKSNAPQGREIPECPAPCGTCIQCQRALHGTWIDFAEVASDDEDSDLLKVDQFREIKAKMGFGAHDGPFKITLVTNADRMTPQAANSVLKLLEEPPAGWIFILTAKDPTLILPTVLSRCQTIRLRPFSTEVLLGLLTAAEVPAARREVCARLANGSWGKGVALAQDENWDQRASLFRLLREPHLVVGSLTDWAASNPAHFDLLLNQLEQISSELVRWSISGERPESYSWINGDGRAALSQHASAVMSARGGVDGARAFWVSRTERIAQARREALAPLNRKILAQDILMPWMRAAASASR
jgi:DNA polymerase-3 subunit delta'